MLDFRKLWQEALSVRGIRGFVQSRAVWIVAGGV